MSDLKFKCTTNDTSLLVMTALNSWSLRKLALSWTITEH